MFNHKLAIFLIILAGGSLGAYALATSTFISDSGITTPQLDSELVNTVDLTVSGTCTGCGSVGESLVYRNQTLLDGGGGGVKTVVAKWKFSGFNITDMVTSKVGVNLLIYLMAHEARVLGGSGGTASFQLESSDDDITYSSFRSIGSNLESATTYKGTMLVFATNQLFTNVNFDEGFLRLVLLNSDADPATWHSQNRIFSASVLVPDGVTIERLS